METTTNTTLKTSTWPRWQVIDIELGLRASLALEHEEVFPYDAIQSRTFACLVG